MYFQIERKKANKQQNHWMFMVGVVAQKLHKSVGKFGFSPSFLVIFYSWDLHGFPLCRWVLLELDVMNITSCNNQGFSGVLWAAAVRTDGE